MSHSPFLDPILLDPSALGGDTTSDVWQPDEGQYGSLLGSLFGTSTAVPTQTQVLYLEEPGTTAPISINDIYQGQIGDCFLLSAVGELALNHPSDISGMIHSLSNGTENVTLYTPSHGGFTPVTVNVTNSFSSASVDNGATQDVVGNQKEIWPQVLEKAIATVDGGYSVINQGGNPTTVMEQLTGKTATAIAPSSLSQAALQAFMAAGDLITMDTANSSSLPYNMVGDHAYMFEKLVNSGGTTMVQLGNPWGTDQPGLIPLSQLSKAVVEVDIGKV